MRSAGKRWSTFFCEKGFDARIKATEVAAKRVIVQKKSEGTRRKKTGLEIERSVFLKDYKDRKDLIKKAKFYPINVRDQTTGRMKMIMVTRIFDQKEGVTAFEDYQDSGVESQNMLANGQIILTEGQQDAAMDAAVAMINGEGRGGGAVSLTAADFGDAGPSSASGPSASMTVVSPRRPAQPNPVEPQKTGAISSDEEDTPLGQSLRTHRQADGQPVKAKAKTAPKKQKGIAGAGGKPTTGSAGGGGSSGGSGVGATDKTVRELLAEVEAAKVALKSAKSLDEIKEELLASLVGRLNTKKGQLNKKMVKDKGKETIDLLDDVNTAKGQLAAIVEVHKAATKFEKTRTRKCATTVGDKVHAMRAAGVTIDMLPTCLNACSTYSRVFTSSCDQKWLDCIQGCSTYEVKFELGNDVTSQQLGQIQRQAATLVLCELVRWQAEQKHITCNLVKQKIADTCELLGAGADATDLLNEMVMSVKHLMKDSSEPEDVRKAP